MFQGARVADADHVKNDDHWHSALSKAQEDLSKPEHAVAFQGFDESHMTHMLMMAGCSETGYKIVEKPTKVGDGGIERNMFIARGRKD